MAHNFNNVIRDTNRFRQVITILAKYGLAQWLSSTPIPWIKTLLRDSEGQRITDLTFEQRVRRAVTELGTTFIKLGQILSTRADLVGVNLAKELGQLRGEVEPQPVDKILATIQQELGDHADNLFSDFQYEPLAAASIAQVHRARLKDGREVVVKVQRSGIEDKIHADLFIMMRLAELAESYSARLRHYQPVATAAKLRTSLLRELDFERELHNMLEFRRNFRKANKVRFAQPHQPLSSKRVLTMDYIEGERIDRSEAIQRLGLAPSEIAENGARIFLDMVFRDGFYHADPHPGNLLVQSDGRIAIIDCGMVGRIENSLRDQIEDMLLAVAHRNAHRLVSSIVYVGSVPNDFDEVLLESEVEEFISEYANRRLPHLNLSMALTEMIEIIRRHQITLPPALTMLLKVLIMLEGTSKSLDPEFSLAELIEPYHKQALLRRFSPGRLKQQAEEYTRDWIELMKILPSDTADILKRVKQGKFDVHLDHRRLDSIVNRLVSGVLTAALFVGSAALWSQQVPPLLFGSSVPGVLGCCTALVIGFGIYRAIRHSGSLDDSH